MKVRIYDVGRGKKSSLIDVPEMADANDVACLIYREVKRMRALGSRDLEVTWDGERKAGTITAGWRTVGRAEALDWIVPGAVVDYHSIIGGPIAQAGMVVRSEVSTLASGEPVVWLDGKAGCVSILSLSKPETGRAP